MSNKNRVEIIKNGNFYNVYEEDDILFNYLFRYKLTNGKVGFPQNSYNKIINTLEDRKINYIVTIGEDTITKDFKNINRYPIEMSKIKNKVDIIDKLAKLRKKIDNLAEDQLVALIEKIDRLLNE